MYYYVGLFEFIKNKNLLFIILIYYTVNGTENVNCLYHNVTIYM